MSEHGIALVTGSASGIGRAAALRLAEDGFDISLNDIASKQGELEVLAAEIQKKGRKTYIHVADVSADEEVQKMVESTAQKLGGLDVMVANAGMFTVFASVMDLSVQDWDRVLAVNARGVFLCYKYAAKQMISQGRGGRIIGASSLAGRAGAPQLSAYSASKFAIRGLTHSAAAELGKYGITVNAYLPGATDTPLTRSAFSGGWEDFNTQQTSQIPVGRLGTPEDIAHLISFLASKRSGFISGQSISANGGQQFT